MTVGREEIPRSEKELWKDVFVVVVVLLVDISLLLLLLLL